MGWATDIHACTTSASPPPEGSAQGARSPAPDSGFPATGAAEFLFSMVASPGNSPHAQVIHGSSHGAEIWPAGRGIWVVWPYVPRP